MAEPAVQPRPEGARARRDPVREERLEILRLLEEGAITADEAATLLEALDRTPPTGPPNDRQPPFTNDPTRSTGGRARQVRIRITDSDTGHATVNLAVPLGLIESGLDIASRYAGDRLLNAKAIRESITAGFQGALLDIDDGGERVEIIVE